MFMLFVFMMEYYDVIYDGNGKVCNFSVVVYKIRF